MSGQKLFAGLVALLVFMVVVVSTVPARMLTWALPATQMQLEGISGTVWRGQTSRARVATPNGVLELGAVQWRLRPWSLLLLSPELHLSSRWGRQQFAGDVVTRGGDDVTLKNVSGSFDASLLAMLFPLAIDGDISVQLETLRIEDGLPVKGQGRVVWQQGRWLSPQGARALGSYALELNPLEGGDGIAGDVVTIAGPLTASGDLQLAGRDYRVDLQLGHEQGFEPALANMLMLVAQPTGDSYQLQMNGSL